MDPRACARSRARKSLWSIGGPGSYRQLFPSRSITPCVLSHRAGTHVLIDLCACTHGADNLSCVQGLREWFDRPVLRGGVAYEDRFAHEAHRRRTAVACAVGNAEYDDLSREVGELPVEYKLYTPVLLTYWLLISGTILCCGQQYPTWAQLHGICSRHLRRRWPSCRIVQQKCTMHFNLISFP